MDDLFGGIYNGKKVLLTGHTGFKGSWLALWLTKLGAEVVGYSLEAPTQPSHFGLLGLRMTSVTGDILDRPALDKAMRTHRPDIVFHLAAQALVRDSYADPVGTFAANVLGTANVLEACRLAGVRAIVNVTSDKCYDNREQIWGYRETDPMGGKDPYSASKGAAELVAQSYRASFFNPADYRMKHATLLASVRAGNVIGGGDWAKDRLIPDIIRSMEQDEPMIVRSPRSVRPWQHVLEPLSGYLLVGQRLLEGRKEFADNWNFGPADEAALTVAEVLAQVQRHLRAFRYEIHENPDNPHEAGLLRLDSSKAHQKLGWRGVWDSDATFAHTVGWYKTHHNEGRVASEDDLEQYVRDARAINLSWTR